MGANGERHAAHRARGVRRDRATTRVAKRVIEEWSKPRSFLYWASPRQPYSGCSGTGTPRATADQALNAVPDYEGAISKTERGKFSTAWRKAQGSFPEQETSSMKDYLRNEQTIAEGEDTAGTADPQQSSATR